MLCTHLWRGLPSGFSASVLPTKVLYVFLLALMHGTYPTHLILRDLINQIMYCDDCKS